MIVIDNNAPKGVKQGQTRKFRPISGQYVENGIRKVKGYVSDVPLKDHVDEVAHWNNDKKQWELPKSAKGTKKKATKISS